MRAKMVARILSSCVWRPLHMASFCVLEVNLFLRTKPNKGREGGRGLSPLSRLASPARGHQKLPGFSLLLSAGEAFFEGALRVAESNVLVGGGVGFEGKGAMLEEWGAREGGRAPAGAGAGAKGAASEYLHES